MKDIEFNPYKELEIEMSVSPQQMTTLMVAVRHAVDTGHITAEESKALSRHFSDALGQHYERNTKFARDYKFKRYHKNRWTVLSKNAAGHQQWLGSFYSTSEDVNELVARWEQLQRGCAEG